MIEEYRFGSIKIDGKTYNHDVELRWTGEVLSWRREESHIIDAEDLKRSLEENPEVIVIGTGESGVAQVNERARKEIEDRGIKLIIDVTGEAVKTFNIINKESKEADDRKTKIIGLFHLTC